MGLASEWRFEKRDRKYRIVSAQNQSITANLVKAKIDKYNIDMVCRVCKKADKSKDHINSGCSMHRRSIKEYMIT